MFKRCLVLLLAAAVATGAFAQSKKRIERAADLPRFTYKVEGKLEDLVRDGKAFSRFAAQVRRDDQSVLDGYDIADKSAQRGLLGVLARIDFLEGRYAEAARRADEIRALEEKPADKLLSGVLLHAMVAAQAKTGSIDSGAYKQEVGRIVAGKLAKLPYAVIANDIKEAKTVSEIIGEALVMGNIRDRLQPVVDKAGGQLSSEFAPSIIGARYALVARLPLKETLTETYTAYLAANKVEKPDIWAARDVDLPAGKGYKPVNVAVWDSGVDASLFPGRLVLDASGKPAFLAFDVHENRSASPLMPIPQALRGRLPQLKSRIKGLSDLQSNMDSPEASEVKTLLSKLKRNEYRSVVEEIELASNYSHGTHVAGIASAGNPYARLVNARIEFDYHLLPDPCPSRELADKNARNVQADVDFFKKEGVRVVNMSWGGSGEGLRGPTRAVQHRQDPRGAQEDRPRVLRHPEERARGGLQVRARHPFRRGGRQLQRELHVRRGHSRRHRAAQSPHGGRGRQGGRRGLVHELRANGESARQRLPGGELPPGRRPRGAFGHVDGRAPGHGARGEDAGREPEAHAGAADRDHREDLGEDGGRPAPPHRPEEGGGGGAVGRRLICRDETGAGDNPWSQLPHRTSGPMR